MSIPLDFLDQYYKLKNPVRTQEIKWRYSTLANIKKVFKTGMTAVEVVVEITKINPEVAFLGFFECCPARNLKESGGKRKSSLSRLIRHNPAKEDLRIYRKFITSENISSYFLILKEDCVLNVLSRVRIGLKNLHIPMMDFCEGSSLSAIEHFLRKIGQEGVILASGRSYHFYGTDLMDEYERFGFLGDCMLSGLADPRYIGHQLKNPFSTLRLSACRLRPKIPEVVSIVAGR